MQVKFIILAVALTASTQAYSLTEAQLNEKCGPLPDAYKECGRTDDKCNEAALRRACNVHECRMQALLIDVQNPVPVPVETGTSPSL